MLLMFVKQHLFIFLYRLGCVQGFCKNHNEFHNILKTAHHFISFILPHGAPKMLRPLIDKVIKHFDEMKINSAGLLEELNNIVNLYKAGEYLYRGPQATGKATFY